MVQPFLLDLLQSPVNGEPLELRQQADEAYLIAGERERFPVRNDIPRFIDDQQFVESFGFQWNAFQVQQPKEDEETFELKTGVKLGDLAGKLVLDAGCGGGRYTKIVAEHGANVVAVDRSQAVEMAQRLTVGMPNVAIVQADLTDLPLRPEAFDLVFSIGVLHHSPETKRGFESIARMVKPGGRLSVWLYRRNTWPQEVLNDALRWIARKLPRPMLLRLCQAAAVVGAVPVINQTLNKVANFSNHPCWENRVCDNFDWYSPEYQHHHTVSEVVSWFDNCGFQEIQELPPAKNGKLYSVAFRAGLIIGSGVNVTGVKKTNSV